MISLLSAPSLNHEGSTTMATVDGAYAQDGVNVSAGDKLSQYAGTIIRTTWNVPGVAQIVVSQSRRSLGGPPRIILDPSNGLFRASYLSLNSDGVGTKVGLHGAAGTYAYTPLDLTAMLADDTARYGGLPIALSSVLDVESTRNPAIIERLFDALVDVARANNIMVINGELAELGSYVGGEKQTLWQHILKSVAPYFGLKTAPEPFRFLWSGTMLGAYHPDLMILGNSVAVGDVVVAFREHGYRSNGISLVRAALRKKFGRNWATLPEAQAIIKECCKPSISYANALAHINGWYTQGERIVRIKQLTHVTGGGIVGKFGAFLKRAGLSAELDALWSPPQAMKTCCAWRGISDREVHKTLNCGQGMLAIVDPSDVNNLIGELHTDGIEAKAAGMITRGDYPVLSLISGFTGNELVYHL